MPVISDRYEGVAASKQVVKARVGVQPPACTVVLANSAATREFRERIQRTRPELRGQEAIYDHVAKWLCTGESVGRSLLTLRNCLEASCSAWSS